MSGKDRKPAYTFGAYHRGGRDECTSHHIRVDILDQMLKLYIQRVMVQKKSGDNVYQFLLYFDLLYDKFTDSEKKEFLQRFVERIERFPEKQPDGRFLKRIRFRFPGSLDGAEVDGMRGDNETTAASIVLLER